MTVEAKRCTWMRVCTYMIHIKSSKLSFQNFILIRFFHIKAASQILTLPRVTVPILYMHTKVWKKNTVMTVGVLKGFSHRMSVKFFT